MPGIRIVTDSAADLPVALIEKHAITVVPLDVRLGDTPAEVMATLDVEGFWRAAAASPDIAETAAPSPGAFQEAFLAARDAGYTGVLCVLLSSAISATYQSAVAAASAVGGEIAVEVVDSRFATMGEGLLVLEAVERVEGGSGLEEAADAVRAAVGDVSVFGTLDTLENLRRGGRIGSAQAFLGSLLSIKPVVEVRDGLVEAESRQRTRAKALAYLVDKAVEAGPLKRLAVVHADAKDLDALLALTGKLHARDETIVTYIGPVIGAHTGPGTVGVCLQRA